MDDPFQFYGTRGYSVLCYGLYQGAGSGGLLDPSEQRSKERCDPSDSGDDTTTPVNSNYKPQQLVLLEAVLVGVDSSQTTASAGPFNSGSEMEAWFNHKLTICKHYNHAPADIPPFDFQQFVLVHQDISPRNMILDAAGMVWWVDWAHAGAYPPAFERAAIVGQYRFPEFNEMVLRVLPRYEVEVRQLRSIWYGLSVASLA